jgi:hypothetical protein
LLIGAIGGNPADRLAGGCAAVPLHEIRRLWKTRLAVLYLIGDRKEPGGTVWAWPRVKAFILASKSGEFGGADGVQDKGRYDTIWGRAGNSEIVIWRIIWQCRFMSDRSAGFQALGPRSILAVKHKCIGRKCLALGLYQHRGALGASGSRNTGAISACCLRNAYQGCPDSKDF